MKQSKLSNAIIKGLLVTSITTPVWADNVDTETIVVSASRTTEAQFEVLAAVDVFNRADIDALKPASISELLNQVAGISTTTQGSEAHVTSVYTRGSNSDHTLILVDGMRVGSATLGQKNLADIPLALIERIEIVRGPRAALWGSDAIGGVIQIFTRKLTNQQMIFNAEVGTHNYQQAVTAAGFGNESHSYTLSLSAEKSNGFDVIKPDPNNIFAVDQDDNDGYKKFNVAVVGSSQLNSELSLDLNGQYNQGRTEIDALYSGDVSHYYNHQFGAKLNWQHDNLHLSVLAADIKDSNTDNYDTFFDGAIANRFTTKRQQVSAIASIDVNHNWQIAGGSDWLKEKISANTQFSETARTNISAFVTTRWQQNSLKAEGAVRYDKVGDVDSETSYNLALGYQISDAWLVSLTQGTAFKAPTFNDLYWPEAFGSSGNPNLKSETADNLEILSRYQQNNVEFELSLYQTDFDNLIEWAPIDSSDPFSGWQPFNVSKAKVKGADVTLALNGEWLSHRVTLSHIDAKNKVTNQSLPNRPHFTAGYTLQAQWQNLNLAFDANLQGSRTDSSGKTLASHLLLNLTAGYQLTENISLTAKVLNLTDKQYMQINEYPGDRRGYRVGLNYQF